MKKKILISEAQLKRIVDTIREGEENQGVSPEIMGAFLKVASEVGSCSMNEGIDTSNILNALKQTFKGAVLASAFMAMTALTAPEVQAQTGFKPNKSIVNIFKGGAKKQCSKVGKQKKLHTDNPTPTTGINIYKFEDRNSKFDGGQAVSKGSEHYYIEKGGKLKEISKDDLKRKQKQGIKIIDISSHEAITKTLDK